ncbi:MAG: DUF1987 family protein [Bacteroidales bacterium]|nr:DUF1987 family protein [Bacteroidales bacterium]
MNRLYIPRTSETPMVDFRPSGVLWIAGNSYPLYTCEFFEELSQWSLSFLALQPPEVEIHLALLYCNDTFAKYLLTLLKEFKNSLNLKIHLFWYGEEGDEDMAFLREVLEECLEMEFEFLEV